MHRLALLIAPALALTACQTVPEADPAGPAPYKAAGTEPFWGLSIETSGMTFSRAGERDVRVSGHEARPSFNGWRYVSDRIIADITFVQCSDGMSDNVYKDSVTVIVDGKTYKGCGGGVVASTR
ncbi:MAG: hypothetical protein IBJ12_09710 [Sphingomonadaceae bacterium]|nr:hypothetical protein [Sphingomonadaceae bacterium]